MKKLLILLSILSISVGLASCDSSSSIDNTTTDTTTDDSSSSQQTKDTTETTAVASTLSLINGSIIDGGTYEATEEDQSVAEASGSIIATITNATLNKSAGDATSANDSSFKGVNAAVRVYDNSTLTISNSTITSSAKNATGVFAYDTGIIYISDSTVNVTGGGAGGIQVAGGGTLYATNLTVNSASKAAIRSDRGGGILVVDQGTYTSTGSNGCPSIYSTADITVKNATCTATNSRAVIIEGKNSVTLENTNLIGNDQSTKSGSVKANVLLYQSASGDADEGTSVFTMTGGSIESESGAMFYCTNTASVINLNSADLILSSDNTLLTVSEGRWGSDGKNGGDCTFNASNQELNGLITVDSISSLNLNLTSSTFNGSISNEGTVNVKMDSNSSWTLTADTYITSFEGDTSNINLNGYTLYINGAAL